MIMLHIGSMVFFLTEILYQGSYTMPVHWIFGLFVFDIVLISRISIMEGFERSALFGVALFAAVMLVTRLGMHLPMLLVAWWAASKLTWDCTFVDGSRDVTGQGLVQAAESRFRKAATWLSGGRAENDSPEESDESEPQLDPPQATNSDEAAVARSRLKRQLLAIFWERRNKNTPGLWAFFFFVAGLPVFAIGQLFVRTWGGAQSNCIQYFAAYVFSGLSLMMLTSLVGLTRYVQLRNAKLPDSIARSWLLWGTGFAALIVAAVLFIPWPNTGFSLSKLVPNFKTHDRTGKSVLNERGNTDKGVGAKRSDPHGAPGQADGPPSNKEGPKGIARRHPIRRPATGQTRFLQRRIKSRRKNSDALTTAKRHFRRRTKKGRQEGTVRGKKRGLVFQPRAVAASRFQPKEKFAERFIVPAKRPATIIRLERLAWLPVRQPIIERTAADRDRFRFFWPTFGDVEAAIVLDCDIAIDCGAVDCAGCLSLADTAITPSVSGVARRLVGSKV